MTNQYRTWPEEGEHLVSHHNLVKLTSKTFDIESEYDYAEDDDYLYTDDYDGAYYYDEEYNIGMLKCVIVSADCYYL